MCACALDSIYSGTKASLLMIIPYCAISKWNPIKKKKFECIIFLLMIMDLAMLQGSGLLLLLFFPLCMASVCSYVQTPIELLRLYIFEPLGMFYLYIFICSKQKEVMAFCKLLFKENKLNIKKLHTYMFPYVKQIASGNLLL